MIIIGTAGSTTAVEFKRCELWRIRVERLIWHQVASGRLARRGGDPISLGAFADARLGKRRRAQPVRSRYALSSLTTTVGRARTPLPREAWPLAKSGDQEWLDFVITYSHDDEVRRTNAWATTDASVAAMLTTWQQIAADASPREQDLPVVCGCCGRELEEVSWAVEVRGADASPWQVLAPPDRLPIPERARSRSRVHRCSRA